MYSDCSLRKERDMKEKELPSVLITQNFFCEITDCRAEKPDLSFNPVIYSNFREAMDRQKDFTVRIFVLDDSFSDQEIIAFLDTMKEQSEKKPLYFLYALHGQSSLGTYRKYLNLGFDDIVMRPGSIESLEIRVYVAERMLNTKNTLLEEREFYRNAVKQEEELSSKVLDQNLSLKKAYQDIEFLNQKLAKVNEELEKLARYDNLSGLLNRLNLFSVMDVEIERSLRGNTELCGIMMDIDHFKKINDTYGHPCGDIVIREIGVRLRKDLRKYDNAGRYGGEEFFMILPDTSLKEARQIGERFRETLSSLPIQCENEELRVTASLGIAQFKPGDSRDDWLSKADKAMYMAKELGRNRVEVE